jgi:hypothetical protein
MPDQILVLVAEDEDLVRLVIVEALEDAGFEVLEAEHAEAALGVLQIHAARVHVLFTDIHMPGAMVPITPRRGGPQSRCFLLRGVPARISGSSPRNAGFWRSRIGTTTSFVIFASLRPRRKPEGVTHQGPQGR